MHNHYSVSMKEISMRFKIIRTLNILFFVIGTIFSLYIISTIVRLFQDPSQHYTTFFLGIAILSSLLTMRDILASEARGFKLTFQNFRSIHSLVINFANKLLVN